METYKIIEQLSSTENSDIFLVLGSDKRVYIKKKIKAGDILAYELLLGKDYKNLVRVIDVDEDENTVILEYIPGTSLELLRGRLDDNALRGLAVQLCDAVYALHENALIHRDIKPSNIMIDDNGVLKLIDFDAARIYKPYTDRDTRCIGTDGFASPEQYGFAQTDERSDIYAVGAALYDIASNGAPVNRLDEYRGALRPVIEKCMKIDPLDRYQTISELKNAVLGKRARPKKNALPAIWKSLSAALKNALMSLLSIWKKQSGGVKIAIIAGIVLWCICLYSVFSDNPGNNPNNPAEDNFNVILDTESYTADTSPVELSSYRVVKSELSFNSYYPLLYMKISNKSDSRQSVSVTFESFNAGGISLGRDSDTFYIDENTSDVFDMRIWARSSSSNSGYIKNDGVVKTIRLVDVKSSPL